MSQSSARTRTAPARLARATAIVLFAGSVLVLAACGGGRRRAAPPPSGPKILTVPSIERMVQMGTQQSVILGEMQRSGTVYRLTPQQERDLRAVGMPVALIAQMEATYTNATRRNPALARSSNYWTLMDGYWYGGLPLGWPRDWVAGPSATR